MKNSTDLPSIYYHCVIEEYDKENDKHIQFIDLKYMCECLPNIKYYAFILHRGETDKREHYHVNLVFGNNGYIKHKVLYAIASRLVCNVNCIGIKPASSSQMYQYFRYLIHLDNPEKIQFSKDDIISNCDSIVNDCLAGVNPFDYGIDRILYLVKSSDTKAELYSKLGLKFSNQYYKIINDLRNLKSSL